VFPPPRDALFGELLGHVAKTVPAAVSSSSAVSAVIDLVHLPMWRMVEARGTLRTSRPKDHTVAYLCAHIQECWSVYKRHLESVETQLSQVRKAAQSTTDNTATAEILFVLLQACKRVSSACLDAAKL
jgi:uncharacterized hydantoinase/oxoprolinase family protein